MKKKFNDQVAKWHEEEKNIPDDAGALGAEAGKGEEEFKVDVHHWLILHGRYTCIARKPRCGSCIIEDLCEFKDKTE